MIDLVMVITILQSCNLPKLFFIAASMTTKNATLMLAIAIACTFVKSMQLYLIQ